MQPHFHAQPRIRVIEIDVKCYNIIQPQRVKCKQHGRWTDYCAFVLLYCTWREDSQKIAENCAKLARRWLHWHLCRSCLVSSVFLLLLAWRLFQCTPSLPWVWSKSRSQSFWEETWQGWSDNDWVKNLRMSKDLFEYLCAALLPHIAKWNMNFRKAIAVHHCVAITLYWPANSTRYRTIRLFSCARF